MARFLACNSICTAHTNTHTHETNKNENLSRNILYHAINSFLCVKRSKHQQMSIHDAWFEMTARIDLFVCVAVLWHCEYHNFFHWIALLLLMCAMFLSQINKSRLSYGPVITRYQLQLNHDLSLLSRFLCDNLCLSFIRSLPIIMISLSLLLYDFPWSSSSFRLQQQILSHIFSIVNLTGRR